MDNEQMKNTLKEILNKHREYKAKWIKKFGNENGYEDWFWREMTA